MRTFMTTIAAIGLGSSLAIADPLPDQIEGWSITPTPHDWQTLGERLKGSIEASPLNQLSRASATMGAKNLGIDIAGNMVVHAYAPQFAVRMLEASVAAGYEAPLRFYITANDDGSATLSYKIPTVVFAPYDDGGEALDEMAAELDVIMADIAANAAAQ